METRVSKLLGRLALPRGYSQGTSREDSTPWRLVLGNNRLSFDIIILDWIGTNLIKNCIACIGSNRNVFVGML